MSGTEVPVLIVGRGPVGMTLALRLAGFGIRSVVADPLGGDIRLSSKAVLMHRESVEILARAGVGEGLARNGVALTGSRTFYRQHELFHAPFPPADPDGFPLALNFPQSETERLLLARVEVEPLVDLRLGATFTSLTVDGDRVTAQFDDGGAGFDVDAAYLVGCDGSRSATRKQMPFKFTGHSHDDHYLIVDVRARLALANERRFMFDPPMNPGRTVLVHPQFDDLWHLDFQVGEEPDIEEERRTGKLDARIRGVIGDVDYELVWWTSYVFKQLIADRFRLGRVFLVGDAAHLYAPYGARGLNSGLADADNLAWKLAWVLQDRAPQSLLDTYDQERRGVAREHFRITAETARFMAPTTRRGRLRRDVTLAAALRVPALRRFVNSGHFYTALGYPDSPIVTPSSVHGGPAAGDVLPDAPLRALADRDSRRRAPKRLRDALGGDFALIHCASNAATGAAVASRLPESERARLLTVLPAGGAVATDHVAILAEDTAGKVAECLHPDGLPPAGRVFVVRPDGHVASRHDLSDVDAIAHAGQWLLHAAGAPARSVAVATDRMTAR